MVHVGEPNHFDLKFRWACAPHLTRVMSKALEEEEMKEQNSARGASISALPQYWMSEDDGINAMKKDSVLRKHLVPGQTRTIEAALKEAERKCKLFPESQHMAEHVHRRFVALFERLVRLEKAPTDDEVIKFCALLNRFDRYYVGGQISALSIEKRKRSCKVQELNHVFHSDIDTLLDILRVPDDDPIREWRSIFDQHRTQRPDGLHVHAIGGKADAEQKEAVQLIEFESAQATFDWAGGANHEVGDPKLLVNCPWFLPLCDIVFNITSPSESEAFVMVCRGTWRNNQVFVKSFGYEGDCGKKKTNAVTNKLFLHEVRVWCQLRHPNIVAFYGACHLGKRYMVSEDASGGQLRDFLRANERRNLLVWQKLYEAALGVQYLHGKNIVHNDLKGDNILVGADGKAKLIDFGLSSIFNTAEVMFVDSKKMGGVHWRSPEYLAGGRVSFASDIYSLAMCILEVIEDDIPWGQQMLGASVRHHVRKHRIPNPPAEMSDEHTDLIVQMTTFDPAQRLTISTVVSELHSFVSAEIQECGRQTASESPSKDVSDATVLEKKMIEVTELGGGDFGGGMDQQVLSEWTTLSVSTSWFVPLDEMKAQSIQYFGESSSGAIYTANWKGTPVVIKCVGDEKRSDNVIYLQFLHEIKIWHQLRHPNVVSFFGANVTDGCYIVGEYASNGTLRNFLQRSGNSVFMWQKLYEAALGLEYLHRRNIVHNDLRCDNILVGADGKAKLMGFASSSIILNEVAIADPSTIVGVQWKAPEYLQSGRPSFASDIFSLAMCILEALSGDIPWGSTLPESTVRSQICQGHIPARPDSSTGDQWNLIELMTATDPTQRVKISYVSNALCQFARDALAAIHMKQHDVNPNPSDASDGDGDGIHPSPGDMCQPSVDTTTDTHIQDIFRSVAEDESEVNASPGGDIRQPSVSEFAAKDAATSVHNQEHRERNKLIVASQWENLYHGQCVTIINTSSFEPETPTSSTEAVDDATTLFDAVSLGHLDMVRTMVENNENSVSDKDDQGRTPLFEAASRGHTDIVRALLDSGASVSEYDEDHRTALHGASAAAAQILIAKGASVNIVDVFGSSPLHAAIERGDLEMVNVLIQSNVSVNHASPGTEAPVSLAGRLGQMSIFKELIEAGASVNVRDANGDTLLISVARWGYTDGVQLLMLVEGRNLLENNALVVDTLKRVAEMCASSPNEFAVLFTRLIRRLNGTHSQIQLFRNTQVLQGEIMTFGNIVFGVCRLFLQCLTYQSPLSRFIRNRVVSLKVRDFHEELDHFVGAFDVNKTAEAWSTQWEEDIRIQVDRFLEILRFDGSIASGIQYDKETAESAILLQYELMKCAGTAYSFFERPSEQVLNQLLEVCKCERPSIPEWFIPCDDVEFEKWNAIEGGENPTRFHGKWMNTSVTITTSTLASDEFEQRASQWYQLNHSHVSALYGACHVGPTRFTVCEYTPNGTLLDFLGLADNRHLTWSKLYEAFLGLHYLHARNYIYGDLRCQDIVIGFDTKAKIGGFDQNNTHKPYLNRVSPPEVLRGEKFSLASDIYAFGMCILEAVTLRNPWKEKSHESVYEDVVNGRLPDRPQELNDAQWSLILEMCALERRDRVSSVYVLYKLRNFARRSEQHVSCRSSKEENIKLEDWFCPQLGSSILSAVHRVVSACEPFPEMLWLHQVLPDALHYIFERLVQMRKVPSDVEVDKFCDLISRVERLVKGAVSEQSIHRHTKSLQVAKSHYLVFAELETILDMLKVPETDPIRAWEKQSTFGKVYKDIWLDSPVVVKFMGYEGDTYTISNELFLHEVRVWHRLKKHPHIVELYGACHVDKRYFVCEYASNGDLRDYLKRAGNDHLVWDKLYEIALGLAYMHGLSVVHNDLKCDNVLVGMDGKAKLIDFGLSAIVGDSEIMVEMKYMGAVHWKSPEYLAGGRPSFASDVYSFAIKKAADDEQDLLEAAMNEEIEHIGSHRVSTATCVQAREPPAHLFHSLGVTIDADEGFLREGTMGPVYRGTWMETAVAVKLIRDDQDLDPIHHSLFLREVTLWYRLRHPHILTLFGACHIDTRYIVSEYASNGTLREYLAQHNDDQSAWKMLYELSLAVQYLHSRNIVHNDLRCDNVLVGGDGKAKLTGFGLASNINEAEIVVDSKHIREAERWRKSPEYLASGIASFESDIYSLGMCILEVLIGDVPKRPHGAEDSVLFQVGKEQIPNRKRLKKNEMLITKPQWQLVRKLTASIPSQRARISQITLKLAQIVRQAITAKSSNGVDKSILESSVLVTPERTATIVTCKSLALQSHAVKTADRARTTLSYAAEDGDLEMCAFLIERGVSVDVFDSAGRDPLSYAAGNGHTSVCELLLKRGYTGRAALLYTAHVGHMNAVRELIKLGAIGNEKDRDGETAAGMNTQYGHTRIAKDLKQIRPTTHHPWPNKESSLQGKEQTGHSRSTEHAEPVEGATAVQQEDTMPMENRAMKPGDLLHAAESGDTKGVRQSLARGSEVDDFEEGSWTELFWAADRGDIGHLRLLLNSGASVNKRDQWARTALFCGARNGHVETVRMLVESGAFVNEKDNDGATSLHITSQNGHVEVVSVLLKNGAGVDLANNNGWTSLMVASFNGHVEVVSELLKNGASVDIANKYGTASLHIASQNGHIEVVSELLKNGASVDLANNNGTTSLHIASQNGHVEVVSELLRNGASVDIADKYGTTSLHIASQNGHVEVVSELLKNGASVDMANYDGAISLHFASDNGHVEVVSELLRNGASVDLANNNEWTSLMVASFNGHVEVVSELLKNGASVDLANNNGTTSLHIASQNGHVEVVSELLKNGASVDMANYDGEISLHFASDNGHVEVVSELLKNGASVDLANNNEWTSLMVASFNGHVEVVSELLKDGASVDLANNNGTTSLHIASQNGHVEVVSELLKNGASVDMANYDGGYRCTSLPTMATLKW
ncbi:Serine/threonine protein kinase, partial [Globisporangium splendens]